MHARAESEIQRRDDGDAIERVATRTAAKAERHACAALWAHVVTHQFHWAGYRTGRWKWPTMPPGAGSFLLVSILVAAATWRALVPSTPLVPGDIPQSVRDRAAVLFVLCWLPALGYLLQAPGARRPIPFFATYGCLYSAYYAVSPMMGISNLLIVGGWAAGHPNDPATAYNSPINLLLAAWLLLLLGYRAGGSLRIPREFRVNRLLDKLPEATTRAAAFATLLIGLAVTFVDRLGVVPLVLAGIATLVKLASQTAIVLLIVLWRRGKLPTAMATVAALGIAATVFMELGGSATGGVMFALFAIFTGFWIGQRAVSARYLTIGLVALAGCVAIRGVMGQWRSTVWVEHGGAIPPIERSRLMIDMLSKQLRERGTSGAVEDGWTVISRRSANTDLLIDVMRRTPSDVPYWNGFTYESLVGAFVPRLFWPSKPQKSLGQDFGHRYGYIGNGDGETSVNLPVVVEFYINFGVIGIVVGMVVLGVMLRAIEDTINRPGQGYILTAAAAPLLARLLVMECDLSLMFGGLPMQLGTLYIAAVVLLRLAGVIPARSRPRPPWFAPIAPEGRVAAHSGGEVRLSAVGPSAKPCNRRPSNLARPPLWRGFDPTLALRNSRSTMG